MPYVEQTPPNNCSPNFPNSLYVIALRLYPQSVPGQQTFPTIKYLNLLGPMKTIMHDRNDEFPIAHSIFVVAAITLFSAVFGFLVFGDEKAHLRGMAWGLIIGIALVIALAATKQYVWISFSAIGIIIILFWALLMLAGCFVFNFAFQDGKKPFDTTAIVIGCLGGTFVPIVTVHPVPVDLALSL